MKKHLQRGEGESSVMLMIFGAAIAVSIGYYAIQYIASVKEARLGGGKSNSTLDENRPPPRSMEEVGGYEITY